MTTLAELVDIKTDASFGVVIQIPAAFGEWRFALELADPLMGTDVEWFDITQFYASDRYQRGASEYMGRYRAAVAQVHLTIDNVLADDLGVSQDILAPWGFDTTPLFGENVTLDAGLLMRASIFRVDSMTIDWYPLWTGRVETWGDASTARGQIRDHLIVVTDLIGDLVNVPTQAADEPWEDWLVDQILAQANWPYGVDVYGDIGSPNLPPRAEPQPSAINEMDAGTDPLGLVWRTLRNGKLVVHPAPWDTTNAVRYDNPLLTLYPGGLVFNWNPDVTDIEYITDDDNEPAGLQRTSLGIVNTVAITMPSGPYLIDNPTSQSKYGMRGFTASWIVDNEPVADDILAARADASQQALLIRSTVDHSGFFPALAIIDHLDPVTFIHTTHDDGDVVTAVGSVRTITEIRELRHANALSWESSVQIDVASSAVAAALLPVEGLAVSGVTDIVAEFDWTNPTQPDVTPTELQFRLIGQSTLWQTTSYDGVGADSIQIGSLNAETVYEFQIRIVRRVNGLITHTSPVRSVDFVTAAAAVPTPVPDGEDTDVDIPGSDDPDDCVVELELWENDGTGWVEVDSWDQSDMTPNGDGTWRLTTPIPNSFFNEGSVYRFVWREICGGIPGPDVIGPTFDPPDDWSDPCTTPPSLANPPYNDVDLIVYVPKICAPDTITEAISGIAGFHGGGYGGILVLAGDPNYRALESNATGGIIAYGEAPQVTGVVSSKTIGAKVLISDAEFQTLFECAAMRLTCTPDGGSNWKAGAIVFTPDGEIILLSDSLDLDVAYDLIASYDADTGELILYVDGIEQNSDTFGEPRETINALPTWFVGAPPT